MLLPGDVIVLLGERDQLEAALKLLTEFATQKPMTMTTGPKVDSVAIRDGSPFASLSLGELGAREELGVLIVGVQRDAERITNPGPEFQILPGDILYVWGSLEQIERTRARAGGVER